MTYKGIDDLISELGKDFFCEDQQFLIHADFEIIDEILKNLGYRPVGEIDQKLKINKIYESYDKKKIIYANIEVWSADKVKHELRLYGIDYYLNKSNKLLYVVNFKNPVRSKSRKRKINIENTRTILNKMQSNGISCIVTNFDYRNILWTGEFEKFGHGYIKRDENPYPYRWNVVVEKIPVQKDNGSMDDVVEKNTY